MIYFLFFCAALVLAFIYGWFHGARWCKKSIEHSCNVTIETPFVITPKGATMPATREAINAESNRLEASIDLEDERKEL